MSQSPHQAPVSSSLILRRNLLVTFLLLIVLLILASAPGYNYAIKDIAISNKALMDRMETRRLNYNMPELDYETKRLFKIEGYWYIQFLRDHTPPAMTTVVLLPPHTAIDTSAEFHDFNSSEVMEYFLYPRLCVSEDEKTIKPELYSKITHVAILNGWGYDKLKYQPSEKPSETVLPVESPRIDTTALRAPAMRPVYLSDTTSFTSPTH